MSPTLGEEINYIHLAVVVALQSDSVKQDLDRPARVRQPLCGGYPCIYTSHLRSGSQAVAGMQPNSCVCENVSLLSLYCFDYVFIIPLWQNLCTCLHNGGLI